jgi:predicted molibdopterin-dependent oxidoreductase YjgC
VYIVGENPVRSFPNRTLIEEALGRLQFLVVQDLFLTETARLADVVLPAASFAERDGTFTSMERRIQRVKKAIDPIGESRPDWQIIAELSGLMGYPMDYSSPEEIMREIAGLVPIYGGVSYQRLEREEMFWPCQEGERPGGKVLYQEAFPEGKGQPVCLDGVADMGVETSKPQLFLMVGGSLYHQGCGTRTSRSYRLGKIALDGVGMHPEDISAMHLQEGSRIRLSSSEGVWETQVKANPQVSPGSIYACAAAENGRAHQLISLKLDPLSKTPETKMCPVKVERID